MLVLQSTLHTLLSDAEHSGENIVDRECTPDNVLMNFFDCQLIVLKKTVLVKSRCEYLSQHAMSDSLFSNMAQVVSHARLARQNCAAQNEVITIVRSEAFHGQSTCARQWTYDLMLLQFVFYGIFILQNHHVDNSIFWKLTMQFVYKWCKQILLRAQLLGIEWQCEQLFLHLSNIVKHSFCESFHKRFKNKKLQHE